jgi:hypothetical protein
MSFTSHRFNAGKQADFFSCSTQNTCFGEYEMNWSMACSFASGGAQAERCCWPGFPTQVIEVCSNPEINTTTQISLTMKHSQKQQDNLAVASFRTGVSQPVTTLDPTHADELALLQEKVFSEAPAPRIPESQEEESFRTLIKTNLPRHKTGQALLQKIRNSMQGLEK